MRLEPLFFCIENHGQIEPMPLSFHGNQHLITGIPRAYGRQEIIRSPDSLASHCNDQIRPNDRPAQTPRQTALAVSAREPP